MNAIEDLSTLIEYIDSTYNKVTSKWCKDRTLIHQKRNLVRDIELGNDIYNNIIAYHAFINDENPEISFKAPELQSAIRFRVKNTNAIEYKIQRYKNSKEHLFGKIPINKCLNDLYGARIIIDSGLTPAEICNLINKIYGGKYKCINSSNNGYKAAHLYFKIKEDNRNYQWELQIWNIRDEKNNIESHELYQQEYTKWERENKEGGIIND